MADFSHVENDTLRAVLEGRIAPLAATLGGCVDITFEALTEDMADKLLPVEVLSARHDAADAALAAHNDDDNYATLAALRQYWSI